MRRLTLALALAGPAGLVVTAFVVPPGTPARCVFWSAWLVALAVGVTAGTYVRRHDPRISARVDGAGITAGVRATLGFTTSLDAD